MRSSEFSNHKEAIDFELGLVGGNSETSFVFITLLFIAVNYSLFFCFTCTMEARRWGSASRQCFHSLLTFTISVARRRRARKSPYRLIADHKHKSRQLLITLKLIRHYYYALVPRTARMICNQFLEKIFWA